jgi:hypothetical protein
MGSFDFLKSKKSPMEEMFEKMNNSIFPKGDKDLDAGVQGLMRILDKYEMFDPRGNTVRFLYLSPYQWNTSNKTPDGFKYK